LGFRKPYVKFPKNLLDNSDKVSEYSPMEPLPIPIPPDLAETLEIHPSNISHVNMGRRHFTAEQAVRVMEASLEDPRLKGLHILDLLPLKYQLTRKWIVKPLPKRLRNRAGR
jgi:hypothetical protein